MAAASRLSTTARALGDTLDALADALAQARPDAVAASAPDIEARVRDFQVASVGASPSGDRLSPEDAERLTDALTRCRRLGVSLSLLVAPFAPPPVSPHGYTPVGQPLPPGGEGTFLTARV